ncbi:MAG: molybdopterin molybdotransferase MoeA [Phyllobacterium sp.]
MALLPVEEALSIILSDVGTLPVEELPIAEAAWRVLGEDLRAQRTQPPFDVSAMDGYAVRAVDIATTPISLSVIGESAAGNGFSGTLGPNEAVRIFTGAPVPKGADTVVIQEDTSRSRTNVEILETIALGRHIRRAGLDFSIGDIVLNAGRTLDPAAISLAASANYATLPVIRRPRVAILATGDELALPGSRLGPDQIVSSNSYGVAAVIDEAGGITIDLGIVGDRIDDIRGAVERAVELEADILVTLGGASVGDHDLVQAALKQRGIALDFWKLALRPGKPMMFGLLDEMRVLGLPGNPVSSLICSHIFLAPLVKALGGRSYKPDKRRVRLGQPMRQNDLRRDYVRATVSYDASGDAIATPFTLQDSSMLSTLANADGLIIRDPFAPAANEGDLVDVLMLR